MGMFFFGGYSNISRAPNINNYFSEESFIDLKRYNSNYSNLIKYISGMSDDDKNRMLESGRDIASKYHLNFH